MQLLAIDNGTQSIRATVVDEEFNVIATAAVEQEMESPHPGWGVQRPSMWRDNTIKAVRKVLSAPGVDTKNVAGVGVAGQAHGSVFIDKKGELIDFPVPLWCDKRVSQGLKNLSPEEIKEFHTKSGNLPLPAWVAFKIQWIKENMPEVYGKTSKVIVVKDYINYLFSNIPATDHSEASGYYCYNAESENWDEEIVKRLGIRMDILPDIIPSKNPMGRVTKEASKLFGIPAGIPVAAGAMDFGCHHLASGTNKPGQSLDHIGTASAVTVVSEQAVIHEKICNIRHPFKGWIAFGILDAGGGSLRWLRDNSCLDLVQQAKKEGADPYELMLEKAKSVPIGADGLFFFPYLQGERLLGSNHSRGVYFGITNAHKREHLIRALLEGVIYALNDIVNIVRSMGAPVSEVHLIGGGARSNFWAQMRADIYRANICTLKAFEGGIMGAALLAGCACGLFTNPEHTAEKYLSVIDRRFQPNKDIIEEYGNVFNRYMELHDVFQPYFNKYYGDDE
jgi:xylulokinase